MKIGNGQWQRFDEEALPSRTHQEAIAANLGVAKRDLATVKNMMSVPVRIASEAIHGKKDVVAGVLLASMIGAATSVAAILATPAIVKNGIIDPAVHGAAALFKR